MSTVEKAVRSDLREQMFALGRAARAAAALLARSPTAARNRALTEAAAAIRRGQDAILAANQADMARAKAQGLSGKVPISGQDATADGSNSIVKGELTVSILKDIRDLAPLAVELADKLLKGETVSALKNYTMAELTNDPQKTGEVPCQFLPVAQVNKDNVYDLVVKSGFQKYDDVYRDIPESERPAKP